jgi:adenine deaminase
MDDLETFNAEMVFKKGKLVGQDGKALFEAPAVDLSEVTNTVTIGDITEEDLEIHLKGDIVNVIRLEPHSLVTEKVIRRVSTDANHCFEHNKHIDILKLVVIERHGKEGSIGLGLIENFKLKGGAIATTIAHDSHNIIAVGDSDKDILTAVEEIKRIDGGIAIAIDGVIAKSLPLPIAGLMSDKKMSITAEKLKSLNVIAIEKLNLDPDIDPFMTLSFLALPVIPDLKLTDMGLFDVKAFEFIPIEVEE